ncbi:MAG: gas vesicle protein GvpN [Desulfohalobiaceae bacterium]|nr:gas vesicle protein GvpN [Desulfohalobiaceae bacterium]
MSESNLKVVSQEKAANMSSSGDQVVLQASESFVTTEYINGLSRRVLAYMYVGYPVHFSGPAGTGKTTLAFHIASQLNRPVILIHGDDEFSSSDLIGKDSGYRKSKVVDNYIRSVHKSEEQMNTYWVDNRLTTACEEGYTLIYDEFTRSRPEANNVLLSVLEEKVLNLPKRRRLGPGYVKVHPEFRVIFTSNPEEYAGVHKTQDALMDRLITVSMGHFDRESEIQITLAKSDVDNRDAQRIVDLVREVRKLGVNNHRPTIRASIAIARILTHVQGRAEHSDPFFMDICKDVLNTDTAKVTKGGKPIMGEKVEELLHKVCVGAGR